MRIDIETKNQALEALFENPNQVVTLDANLLIPPYRQIREVKDIPFPLFHSIWLCPIFETFPKLAIHEAVLDELISSGIKTFIRNKVEANPPKIIIHKDSELSSTESSLRNSIENRIYPHTLYDPTLNNRQDRGEVKTLAYIAAKNLIYFAAHDCNAIQLVENAESWSTGLDNVQAIRMYEIIFYLCKRCSSYSKGVRSLYKYQYFLTEKEKSMNPGWGEFIESMESLYRLPCKD